MEDEEGMMVTETDIKHKRDEVAQGKRKQQKEADIPRRRVNILPRYLREHETQQDSIQKTGLSFNRNRMTGRRQINGIGFHRWCFVADV